jgi:hypothetical protein
MNTSATCKNCGNRFVGKFCNNCGEKIYTEKDRSVKHILSEGLHFVSHLDGTLLTTIKTIFTRPGQLSLDYCDGKRKKYFKPLSFFLLLVILYLLFPVFEGLNMKLYFHQTHNLYGKYASAKVAGILSTHKYGSYSQLAEAFHHASEKTSKFLLFIVIPFMAFFSWAISFKKRKLYFDNFVFTIEAFSFYILWGFLLLPLFTAIYRWITGSYLFTNDLYVGITISVVFIIYLAIAAKRFFHFKWWYSIIYAILFSVALFAFLECIYKFILFVITINMV